MLLLLSFNCWSCCGGKEVQLHVEEQPQGDAMAAAGLNLWCRSDGCRALLLLGHGCTGEGG